MFYKLVLFQFSGDSVKQGAFSVRCLDSSCQIWASCYDSGLFSFTLKRKYKTSFWNIAVLKRKGKKPGMVDGVQNICPKKERRRICSMCECSWTPALVACKPQNCIFQFLLSENVVLCYILMNVMFKWMFVSFFLDQPAVDPGQWEDKRVPV